MSETETRDAAAAVNAYLLDLANYYGANRTPDVIEYANGTDETAPLRVSDLLGLQAEQSRLRAVVEAVQALADDVACRCVTAPAQCPVHPVSSGEAESGECPARHPVTGNPCVERGAHDDHRAMGARRMQIFGAHLAVAPAPVLSGGAESGERTAIHCVEPGCPNGYAWRGTQHATRRQAGRDGWTYQDGDHCPEHSPAPVLPWWQADGEGEATRALMKAMGCRRVPRTGVLANSFYDYCERHPRSLGYGDWDIHRRECPEARRLAGVALAARPVLSREALRERIEEHLHASLADDLCWKSKPETSTWGRWARRRAIHLADVLAGGEQDG